jgi:UDP-N-acetylglucosamine 2-epimerase (non-hydrolysing)
VSRPLTVLSVVGARPNFMKVAPIVAEIQRRGSGLRSILVHTGQHYDEAMSSVFLEELGVGAPDHMLNVGPGSHAQTTARVMERIEPVLRSESPDVVLVPGDVTSTLASALVAAKLGLSVAHVEAGLRSFDRTMPEEVNRVLTDQVSDLLFTHSPEARANLRREGISDDRIHMVGNTMIDTLTRMRGRVQALDAPSQYEVDRRGYLLVTLHRPALVDGPLLRDAIEALADVAHSMPVIFPCHPRTLARLGKIGATQLPASLRIIPPLGYLAFLSLLEGSAAVVTDSGGVQEETTYLNIPCFTLRANTERPVTCELGTNVLLGLAPTRIREVPSLLASPRQPAKTAPPGWDGAASGRILDVLTERYPVGTS